MAHLAPVRTADAGLFVKFVYWFAKRRLGRVPTPVGIMAHHLPTLRAVGAFELATEKTTALDLRLRELAVLKCATIIGCRFCIDIGASIARSHGITESEIRGLLTFEENPCFDQRTKRVLAYAVAMTETPLIADGPMVAALREDLGVAGLVELTSSIAWENYRARFNHAMGATEDGFSEGTLCLLPSASASHAGGLADVDPSCASHTAGHAHAH
jgi:AhpD family alkylhydroperoxidase